MSRRWITILLTLNCLAGCSGVSPAQVGQTVGTIAGSAIAPGPGGMLGAFVGMLAGMLVQGHVDKVTETRERQTLGKELASAAGMSSDAEAYMGEPTRVWVDETMMNGRVVAGHFDTRAIP